ncbi:hypothetical protein PACILC2_14930 [Paenibacillus cisolokensis]|uniref:Peptidyl-prolyl cis-trans isomerase n=1 Tax=Paenibacillus cisolokensis TaxID=1658519 RepID=A0ABQ4N407_9BACL|nr:peptidylprolyl isomerase [Paenibacillus cisolokensis]GIQ62925.1 hypothetical protein PACILC2_14930 [Paenibacillus cisolokensis]
MMHRMRLVPIIGAAAAFVLLLTGCGQARHANSAVTGEEPNERVMRWDKMPDMTIDLNKTYKARFQTNKGEFTVKLFAEEAPTTVNNFVFLAREGFYDGLPFFRIIESYMIQTGDPDGTGTGGPGYTIPDELDTGFRYEPGIVAMANTGKPNTGGSQFFIGTGPDMENLNQMPNYTIFGKVESGMETVLELARTPVGWSDVYQAQTEPLEEAKIEKVTIIEE